MNRKQQQVDCTSFYLRTPIRLDDLVEAVGRAERRTKTAVLTLALEEYAERHHPELYLRYKEGA
ncbi:MAG: hypothetical protein K2V38_15815 [Gemmataceae bacterium]|nr:hypothetical protein [Gemmataceae bacterium]